MVMWRGLIMARGFVLFTLLLILTATPCLAQLPGSSTGLSWGITRTWWGGGWQAEGYPQAGTAGPFLSLRRVSFVSDNLALSPYLNYYWMTGKAINATFVQDSLLTSVTNSRTYFREIDLGLNLHYFPVQNSKSFYFGGGPSIRWGQAGKQVNGDMHSNSVMKGAWFGLTALVGLVTPMSEGVSVFFEPQFTFSPDEADRWQTAYPPTTLNLIMGVLF
jgi:hypothetical protein